MEAYAATARVLNMSSDGGDRDEAPVSSRPKVSSFSIERLLAPCNKDGDAGLGETSGVCFYGSAAAVRCDNNSGCSDGRCRLILTRIFKFGKCWVTR